ncbi:cysteine peptidase family C39 domain-containing protein [Campylobacter sp. MIT 21-1685]|uniref:C39 family peptidase n=1 Tax=unclassified Campylobacter TaxID=2593542 RepID=UPI00224B435D|nr:MULTISPECIES: cysteine peptidase family C39 domain-containing protein [unclassified Campylobacter]MCX2682969.1 cysteine peptidase family C39 domain-containing protein [Campylobacter sp. MIT 21-1684]MCX2751251.1 cysteine peptidase family C39 domain-containing protein [Campylobacter sp. MIT 21-1682]MCX2807450.1 cysteine peptidase family C39 domain-containing protein [Campylobacter sp. MIT 21-1685]
MSKIQYTLSLCFFILSTANADFIVKSMSELKNEKFIRQKYEESCGTSSLANLLNLFSFKQYSEADILKVLQNKTSMLSFLELKNTALKLGFESDGYELDTKEFEFLTLPVIAKIEKDPRYPHFVVVQNLQGDFVSITDPNFGVYIATKNEFYSLWGKKKGFVLVVVPKKFTNYNLQKPFFFGSFLLDKNKRGF